MKTRTLFFAVFQRKFVLGTLPLYDNDVWWWLWWWETDTILPLWTRTWRRRSGTGKTWPAVKAKVVTQKAHWRGLGAHLSQGRGWARRVTSGTLSLVLVWLLRPHDKDKKKKKTSLPSCCGEEKATGLQCAWMHDALERVCLSWLRCSIDKIFWEPVQPG